MNMKSLDFSFSSSSPRYNIDKNERQWKEPACTCRSTHAAFCGAHAWGNQVPFHRTKTSIFPPLMAAGCGATEKPFTTDPPHWELTYSLHYPSKPFHIQPEEPTFHKCTGGTWVPLWFQDLIMLESNPQPPPKKTSDRFLEPDLLVNWVLTLSLHIHGWLKGKPLRT